MRSRDDVFTQFIARNAVNTAVGFITEDTLKQWYRDANLWSAAYHKWPFTEGRIETTFASGTGSDSDEYLFEGYKADSFRLIYVGGKRLRKLNFEDYKTFREEQSESDDRVYSDFGKLVYINPKADVSGTLVAFGQYQPVIDVTDETGLTVFSDWDAEGNEAIVEKMGSFQKRKERKFTEALAHERNAEAILDKIWQRVLDEQHKYQTHAASGGMFERIDVLEGAFKDDLFKRDQF